jgi:signal transduction histidine kinase
VRRDLILDALLWLTCTFVLVALRLAHGVAGPELPTWWHVVIGSAVLAVAIAVSRRWPLLAVVLVAPTAMASQWAMAAVFLLAYLAGRRAPQVRPAAVVFAGVLAAGAVALLVTGAHIETWLDVLWGAAVSAAFPWLAGMCVRTYRDLAAGGWTRAEQLERQQRIVDERARLRERTRIAGDMHDALGHDLSLIALRAGALELAADLSEQRRVEAAELRRAAGRATEQLREVIGMLRLATDQGDPDPGTESVAALVARARAAGVDVSLDEVPTGRAVPPAKIERALHRIVQESLTNATKHAPGARVTVLVSYRESATRATVLNGPATRNRQAARGNRSGLIGLEERVRLLGGSLRAESDEHGGFVVDAHLPHSAAALPPSSSESARQRAAGQRRLRRTAAAAIALPGLIGGAVLLGAYLLTAGSARQTVLTAEQLAGLRIGQPRAEAASVLPRAVITERIFPVEPAHQPGATCQYYRSSADGVGFAPGVHRVCFRDEIVVSTDFYPVR